ncbi:MAG: NUDIX hydrolase [Planctomycetota bacterium]|nr:NUDIX hydrolase [Planctomycetota bacterium]
MRPDYLGVFGYLERDDGVLLVSNRRTIDGRDQLVWDLPGGGVEAGETLAEALRREMREETGLAIEIGEMFLVAEGERTHGGRRTGVWRSMFFRIEADGTPDTSGDPQVEGFRFVARAELSAVLGAPYHGAFQRWLATGVAHGFDVWAD